MMRSSRVALLRTTKVLREQETWRDHGISYVKYLNVCTAALHMAVKESEAAKYTKFSVPGYVTQVVDETAGVFVPVEKPVPSTVEEYMTLTAPADKK